VKKVEITYNPYKLETTVLIDGKQLKENSEIRSRSQSGNRLQEWVEDLPALLVRETNERQFEVDFRGTEQDFEDLTFVLTQAVKDGILNAKINGEYKAIEIAEKEQKIKEVFAEINADDFPFEELRSKDMTEAFNKALNSEIDICVVATMSAGKSTLINAILGEKIMPSAAEACTAIITRLKNTTDANIPFSAKIYNEAGNEIESHAELDLETMQRLNQDKNVSEIRAEGNIPIVSSKEMKLILIDTPGPTNARNPDHKKVFYEMLSKSSKPLLLFLMDAQYESEDTFNLLKNIAATMKEGGKQSKDRFIFAVNKLDSLDPDVDKPQGFLARVCSYIEDADIKNPHVFGVAAQPAMNIRLMEKGKEISKSAAREARANIEKLNDEPDLHFEKYAPLPASLRGEINGKLDKARAEDDSLNNPQTALIHTGITSIEAAIRQYVEKYAKTAKIKTLVATFMGKLEGRLDEENMKNNILSNKDKRDEYKRQIDVINKNLADGKQAKQFQNAIDDALKNAKSDMASTVDAIAQGFERQITKYSDQYSGKELTISRAERVRTRLEKYAEKITPEFQSKLDAGIRENLIEICNELLKQYRNKLATLAEGLGDLDALEINPLKLMGGGFDFDIDVEDFVETRTERIVVGEEWVENRDRMFFQFWKPKGHYRDKIETKTENYVDGSSLIEEFTTPIQEWLLNNRNAALEYAGKESQAIVALFRKEFDRLDAVLNQKMLELEDVIREDYQTAEKIEELQENLKILQAIKNKVESILDI